MMDENKIDFDDVFSVRDFLNKSLRFIGITCMGIVLGIGVLYAIKLIISFIQQ